MKETPDIQIEQEMTVVKDRMQILLITRMGIDPDDDVAVSEWIDTYSKRFDDYIQANREIIEPWQSSDSETQEKIIEDIRKIISGDEG